MFYENKLWHQLKWHGNLTTVTSVMENPVSRALVLSVYCNKCLAGLYCGQSSMHGNAEKAQGCPPPFRVSETLIYRACTHFLPFPSAKL